MGVDPEVLFVIGTVLYGIYNWWQKSRNTKQAEPRTNTSVDPNGESDYRKILEEVFNGPEPIIPEKKEPTITHKSLEPAVQSSQTVKKSQVKSTKLELERDEEQLEGWLNRMDIHEWQRAVIVSEILKRPQY